MKQQIFLGREPVHNFERKLLSAWGEKEWTIQSYTSFAVTVPSCLLKSHSRESGWVSRWIPPISRLLVKESHINFHTPVTQRSSVVYQYLCDPGRVLRAQDREVISKSSKNSIKLTENVINSWTLIMGLMPISTLLLQPTCQARLFPSHGRVNKKPFQKIDVPR